MRNSTSQNVGDVGHNFGVIGNQFSAALISPLGSIDWCCFPYLDSPSHFGSYFNKNKGGYFQIAPQGEFRSEQRYLPDTLVLETTFETPTGIGVILDWMPIDSSNGESSSFRGPILCRRVEVKSGKMAWMLTCSPRFRYGQDPGTAEYHYRGALFRGKTAEDLAVLHSSLPLQISGNQNTVMARFTLESGESTQLSWAWGRHGALSRISSDSSPSQMEPAFESTRDFWRKDAHSCASSGCAFEGPWHDSVVRSGLTLKVLEMSYGGAISEAVAVSLNHPTLPEQTWGHRLAFFKEGAFRIQALVHLGYVDEAHAYFAWIQKILERDGTEDLQALYTLDDGRNLPEYSPPNREAGQQFQLDIYGHAILATAEYYKLFGKVPPKLWTRIAEIADYICQAWRRPDHGVNGYTPRPEHFVASKLFSWVALDRAIWLASELGQDSPARWSVERNTVHRMICEHGYDSIQNSFVRSFGSQEIDGSVLWAILVGFLPADDPRIQGTLDRVRLELSQGVLVKKAAIGSEKYDLWTSLLLISCLALTGQRQEAVDRLAEICTYSNSLGLMSDEVDLNSHEHSHYFLSATVHFSLVNASLYVAWARGRLKSEHTLIGTPEAGARAADSRIKVGR